MKKVAISIGLLVLLCLAACSGDDEDSNTDASQETDETGELNTSTEASNEQTESDAEEEKTHDEKEKTLEELVEHFKQSGFNIGDKTKKAPEMIGASEGFGIEVDGEDIEIYQYELDSEDLDEIKSNGEYEMEGFGPFPAVANGNFVLISHEEHSETEKITTTFESF